MSGAFGFAAAVDSLNTLGRLVMPFPISEPALIVLFFIIDSTASTLAEPVLYPFCVFSDDRLSLPDRITAAVPAATGHAMDVPFIDL